MPRRARLGEDPAPALGPIKLRVTAGLPELLVDELLRPARATLVGRRRRVRKETPKKHGSARSRRSERMLASSQREALQILSLIPLEIDQDIRADPRKVFRNARPTAGSLQQVVEAFVHETRGIPDQRPAPNRDVGGTVQNPLRVRHAADRTAASEPQMEMELG